MRRPLLSLLAALLTACTVPIAGGLDDREAGRVVVVLDHASIEATKEADPAADGKWRVSVPRDDAARALGVLRDEELPRAAPPGVLDAIGKGSLVPSEAAEHAQLVAGIAGDLERSLEGIDGVLHARVHLNVPPPSPLRDIVPARASASVLLEHRGATPPLSADAVARLISGGVANLLQTDVAVVFIPHPAPPSPTSNGLAHVGPIAVARSSLRALQAATIALVALVAILSAVTLILSARLSRLRAELAEKLAEKAS